MIQSGTIVRRAGLSKQNATLGSFVPFAMSALFCQYLQSNDWSTVCFLVMMVSKSAFWFSNSCLPAPLPLWATSCRGSWEQAADWNVIRQSEWVRIPTLHPRLNSYSARIFLLATLLQSFVKPRHCVLRTTGCDSSIEILHCLHMIRQVQWCHYGFNVSGGLQTQSAWHTIQIQNFLKKHFADSG